MKHFCAGLTASLALMLALAGPAHARDPDWTVEVGAVGRVRPTHLGSGRYVADAAPVVEVRYGDRLSLSFDDGAKWTIGEFGPFAAGAVVEYRQSFNDDLPPRAFHMADVVEAGGFAQARTPVGVAEMRLRHALGGYDGWSGELAFNTGAPVTPKLELSGQLRVSWADSNFSQEYFGLKPHAAGGSRLPRFLDEDYISAGGEFDVIRELTPSVRLVATVSADRMLGEIPTTPLVQSRNILVGAVGLTWRWRGGAR